MTLSAETIYALSTAQGKAGVAVIRVSGDQTTHIIEALTRKDAPLPREAVFTGFFDAAGTKLDEGLVLYFQGPNSFTGEDVAEFQIHGSRAVLNAFFETLSTFPATRMAQAGEFTQRAFLNGKMDLAEVEGLADLIAADTEAQRAQALAQMNGALSELYDGWRDALLRALAHIEADIDFPDEDLPPEIVTRRMDALQKLKNEIDLHLADNRRGERLRNGFSIALLGAPNAGKSSLINALAQRDAAIVSATAGTTRDIIDVHLDVGGYPVMLADTAGIRDTKDAIEEEGVRRALARAEDADLKIVLFDAQLGFDEHSKKLIDDKTIIVLSKCDTAPAQNDPQHFCVSAKTGQGIPALLGAVEARLKALMEQGRDQPPLTRPRHREALKHAVLLIQTALDGYAKKRALELVAEDIRLALRALSRITGRVDVEDLLDVIFRDFCIGK